MQRATNGGLDGAGHLGKEPARADTHAGLLAVDDGRHRQDLILRIDEQRIGDEARRAGAHSLALRMLGQDLSRGHGSGPEVQRHEAPALGSIRVNRIGG
jgi:hypothetical protein